MKSINQKIVLYLILLFLTINIASASNTMCYVPHGGDVSINGGTYQEMYSSSFVITDSANDDKHEYKVKNDEDVCNTSFRNLPEKDLTNDGSIIFLNGTYSTDTYIEGHNNSNIVNLQVKGFKDKNSDGAFKITLYEFNPTTNTTVFTFGNVSSSSWVAEATVYDIEIPITPHLVSAGNTLAIKVEAANDVCPDYDFEYKFKVDEAFASTDTTFTDTYCDSFASDYKNYMALVLNETPITLNVSLEEPINDFAILINDSFQLTCNVTNIGPINFSQVNLFARYTNSTIIPTSGGQLNLNESGNYSCGTLNSGNTCNHSWTVTANNEGSDLNIECYAEANPSASSQISVRVDVMASANNLTLSSDKSSYSGGESITATLSSSIINAPYNVLFYNSSGSLLENLSGTTPSTANEIFFETYTLPNDISNQDNNSIIFFIEKTPGINQTIYFNTSTIGPREYAITNILLKYDETFLGYSQSVKGTVIDNESEYAVGECCRLQIDDAITGAPIFTSDTVVIDGAGSCETHWNLDKDTFEAPKSYSAMMIAWQCSDEDLPSSQRKRGTGVTSFDVIQYLTEQDSFLPITDKSLYAGFDKVELTHSRMNNFGQPLEIIQTVWFANIDTEQDYHYSYLSNLPTTVNVGLTDVIEKYDIPQDLPTGSYRIEKNIYYLYQGEIKEFSFVKSEPFNVTGIEDIFVYSDELEVKDYFGITVNLSAATQGTTNMPNSNYTNPYIVLTEGFGYQVCKIINNTYDESVYWHLENIVINNPTTSVSFEEFNTKNNDWQRPIPPGVSEVCFKNVLPLDIPTHSDYRFEMDSYIGTATETFDCADCKLQFTSDYFYIGTIEDSIVFNKWYEKPTNMSVGTPLTYIVTAREEYLSMNDDCAYESQETIPWGSSNVTCYDKNDNTSALKIDYNIYPRAGEKFKVCFQIQNYFSDEIDLELYDIYLDDDSGETVIYFQDEETEDYVPSITNDKLYLATEPSRALEQNGNLIDGYASMCSKWITLPNDIKGGNDWDIQGKVKINTNIYDLEQPVVWNWESDEFPIYGLQADRIDYISINTLTDSSSYKIGDELFICSNVSSYYPEQLDLNIHYNYRCSATKEDNELDRNIYGEYDEIRSIGATTTQNQCHKFIVPDDNYFKTQGTVHCYASTVVDIPKINERVTSSSPFFNISKHEATINLTPLEGYEMYVADDFKFNLTLQNPFVYREEEYKAHYSISLQTDNSLIYLFVDEITFDINESEKTFTVSLPLQDADEYVEDNINKYQLGAGWIPGKRDSFLQKLQMANQEVDIQVKFHTHTSFEKKTPLYIPEAEFKETFTGFTYQKPGIISASAIRGEPNGTTDADYLYLDNDGLLNWYIMFNISSREAPDGTSTTLPRETWITIEDDNDVIRRCYNNYEYTNYNNASSYNLVWLKQTCNFEDSQAMLGKKVKFYMQGQWSSTPYIFDTATISQPVIVNSISTLYTSNYSGGDIIYLYINFTGYKEVKYDLNAYLQTSEGVVIDVWGKTQIETFNIPIGEKTVIYPLLLPVNLDSLPYSSITNGYDLDIYLTNQKTGKIDIETKASLTINPFNAIISENITSGQINDSNPLTIDYELNIPIKDMMFYPNKNQPFRIKYHFISQNGSGQAVSQFTTIDGQYAPLEVYTMLPAGTIQNISVVLQPTLPAGTYALVEEIEIDPEGIWEGVHKGTIGSFVVSEATTGEPRGLVDTTETIYTLTNEINTTTHAILENITGYINTILDEINYTLNNLNLSGANITANIDLSSIETKLVTLQTAMNESQEFSQEAIFLVTDSIVKMKNLKTNNPNSKEELTTIIENLQKLNNAAIDTPKKYVEKKDLNKAGIILAIFIFLALITMGYNNSKSTETQEPEKKRNRPKIKSINEFGRR